MLEDEIKRLEEQVASLLGLCRRLREENRSLRADERKLLSQNAMLAEKNRLARTRIEHIIGKLKALDTH